LQIKVDVCSLLSGSTGIWIDYQKQADGTWMWGDNTFDPLDSAILDLTYWNGTVDGEDCAFGARSSSGGLIIKQVSCLTTYSSIPFVNGKEDYDLIPLCIGEVQTQTSPNTVVDTMCF